MVIGLLVSPIPVVALLIMLMTNQARQNGLALIAGWLSGITGVGLLVVSFPFLGKIESDNVALASLIRTGIGAILITWAAYKVFTRYHNRNSRTPKFFSKLDQLKPRAVFGVGILVSAGNIKNLGFSAAAAIVLNQTVDNLVHKLGYLVAYSLVGSLTLFIPMVLYLVLRHQADPILQRWKIWLISYHDYILAGVVVFIGVMIISGGH